MDKDFAFLLNFIMDAAETRPSADRVRIYRGLSRICGDPLEQQKLQTLALDLTRADLLCCDLKLSFSKIEQGGTQGDGNGSARK